MKSREQTIADMTDTKHQIGDWVQTIYYNGVKFVAKVASQDKVLEGGREYPTVVESWDKWVPEEGQYCWFYFDNEKKPYLSKFKCMSGEDYIAYDRNSKWTGMGSVSTNVYKRCEPFIGTLPSGLENNYDCK